MIYIVLILLIIIAFCIWSYEYCRWDKGINPIQQEVLEKKYPIDRNKGVVFISRDMVGLWLDENHIYPLKTLEPDLIRIKNLYEYNNIILYIPVKDRSDIEVHNLTPSIRYIRSYGFPISYITRKLPPRFTVNPIDVGKNRWILYYRKEFKI